mgnify:CR=1 FL=1
MLGLALQNTLADVFAGIAVGIERPYAIGDQVCLDGPVEGEVVKLWEQPFGNSVCNQGRAHIFNRLFASDTRSTAGSTVADKNCEKIHFIAPNIYCCGAGTAAVSGVQGR